MNNRLFIATGSGNEVLLDAMRERLESPWYFDRHGDVAAARKAKRFGFETVVPRSPRKWLWRMLGCSYVYFPCGWHEDRMARHAFVTAYILGKVILCEEDSRCR